MVVARPVALVAAAVSFVIALALPAFRTPLGELAGSAAFPIAIAVALLVLALLWRSAPATAGWLALTIVGWSASLQLIDAPPAVAYQHIDFSGRGLVRVVAWVACVVQLLACLTLGRHHMRTLWQWLRREVPTPVLMLVVLALLAPAAVPAFDLPLYALEIAVATLLQLVSVGTLVAAVRSMPESARAEFSAPALRLIGPADAEGPRAVDGWVVRLALAVVLVASLLSWASYEWHPHVPDEVVYLLHARYLAEGMMTMPLPPVPEAFHLDLMHYEATRWYSPVPPGWPFVLAIGARFGVPWLVNPVLAGIGIVLAYLTMGRLVKAREARLTTLLLACSPWFLFMSMNLMTQTLSMVSALAAALGVAISRERGTWLPSLLAGLAVGLTSLVRPLEGLVVALVLGFWSLGARGRWFRLAPSTALVIGTVASGLLVRPYNAYLTGSSSVFPIMAYIDKYYARGSNEMGFGPNRGLGWPGLDPFPGHGPIDVVVNSVLNSAQLNSELLGWPVGAIVLMALVFLPVAGRAQRVDWWLAAVILGVVGAHSLYWFSGGPDFGPRYWYLIVLPCCALVARFLQRFDDRVPNSAGWLPARTIGVYLAAATLFVYVPWRAMGKYHNYRGMRPDVRQLARQHDFGRSLVLVRGARHPDYASAATYNPVDLHSDEPIYAWDASAEIRAAVLAAYPDRTVWILDGPSLTRGRFAVAAGPLTPAEALSTSVLPNAAGSPHVYDPVSPPRRGTP